MGASGVVVDMVALFILHEAILHEISALAAKVLAAECAVVNNFIWNDRVTFRRESRSSATELIERFLRYNAVCLLGVAIATFSLWVLTSVLGFNLYLANLIAIALGTIWNFTCSKLYAWVR